MNIVSELLLGNRGELPSPDRLHRGSRYDGPAYRLALAARPAFMGSDRLVCVSSRHGLLPLSLLRFYFCSLHTQCRA